MSSLFGLYSTLNLADLSRTICSCLGAVHILRNTLWGGGGLPDLLQYYIGGGLPNLLQYYIGVGLESLLQYYSFVRKMEGYNPFSALY